MERAKPDYYEALVEWLGNPMDDRTQKKFAEDVGVDDSTILKYRRLHDDDIQTAISQARKRYINILRVAAYKSLFKRINKSDNAVKMALQIAGDLVERTESRVEYLTPEQKKEKIHALLAAIEAKTNNDKPVPPSA